MAYRAEIEIGVRGTERLRDLRNTIDELNVRVNKLNDLANVFNAPIQSITNYTKSLNTALNTLQKVELGTKEEADAILLAAKATIEKSLVDTRQNNLLAERIKLLQEESRVQKLTAAGIFETTRFKQPIGPARPSGVVPAGGFPVAGPLPSPGFQATQKQVGKFGENLALGAGFPLLFGGGPGSVAGSVLGSFVGSGFGGQILGSALGQILDQLIQKTAQLGSALQTLDLSKIEKSGIRINANLATQIDLLRQTGQAVEAQNLVENQVLDTTGALPGTTQGISDAVNVLSNAWKEISATAGVTLGIIGAPFAAALGVILNAANALLKGINVIHSAVRQTLKVTGEWIVELIGGKTAVENLRKGFADISGEVKKAREEYQPILSDLNDQVLLNRELLNLEKQRKTGTSAVDKTANAVLDERKNITKINFEYDSKIREENAKITLFNKAQVQEVVRLLNVKRNQAIEEANITATITKALIAEQEKKRIAEENKRAAKEAAQAAEAHVNAISSITKDYYSDQLKIIDTNIQLVGIQEGSAAALQRQLDLMPSMARIRTNILTVERDSAIKEAQKTGTVKETIQLYEQKLRLLAAELAAEQAVTQQKQAQAKLDEFTKIRQALQSAIKPFQDLRQEQELQNQAALTYNRLISEGILPSEAERIANFEKLVAQQLANNEAQIIDTEATILKAKTLGLVTTELEKQLDILKQQQDVIKGQAAKGPGPKPVELTPSQKIIEHIGKLKEEIKNLTNVGNIAITVADGIGNAFGQAFQGLVTGAMTAQQALASFFKSVGEMFVSMAAQIIAKQMVMITLQFLLKALGLDTGGGGGGGIGASNNYSGAFGSGGPTFNPGAFSMPELAANGAYWQGGFQAFADGGMVNSPTLGLVGEGGQPEYIIPASKMSAAMNRYSAGARGSAVIPSGDGNATMGTDTSIALSLGTIDVRYTIERINSVDYVTNDQFQQGMAQAAKQGAQQGEQRTLRRLQQSRSTRSRLGMR